MKSDIVCDVTQSGRNLPTFQNNRQGRRISEASRVNSKSTHTDSFLHDLLLGPSSYPSANVHHTKRRHIPEDSSSCISNRPVISKPYEEPIRDSEHIK
jgi:hypothetical protein